MGRPLLKLDPGEIERMAEIHATDEEIAYVLGCSVDTLKRRFSNEIERGRASGKISIRRKQFELAMAGDVRCLIWLGKVMLGQTDKVAFQSEGDGFEFVS